MVLCPIRRQGPTETMEQKVMERIRFPTKQHQTDAKRPLGTAQTIWGSRGREFKSRRSGQPMITRTLSSKMGGGVRVYRVRVKIVVIPSAQLGNPLTESDSSEYHPHFIGGSPSEAGRSRSIRGSLNMRKDRNCAAVASLCDKVSPAPAGEFG